MKKFILLFVSMLIIFAITERTPVKGLGFFLAGPSGGKGGRPFTPPQVGFKIAAVKISSGRYIDSIQVTWVSQDGNGGCINEFDGERMGGVGGALKVFRLACDEHIVRVFGKYGNVVDSLTVVTNKGRTMTWGGNGGVVQYVYIAPPGSIINGFWGQATDLVDAVGVVFRTF